jgi:hypothetical protein
MQIDVDGEIKQVTDALDAARKQVAVLEPKLEWLRQGQAFYGNGSIPAKKPTLTDAIIRVMSDGSEAGWTALQVMEALRARGWMPNGTSAEHVVRAKLAFLARGDAPPLRRIAHGIYEISASAEHP